MLLLFLTATSASAATLTRGPYLQLVTTDSVTVVWNTDVAAACVLAIRRANGGPVSVLSGATSTVCAIAVTNLAPGTAYAYTPRTAATALRGESVFQTDDPAAPYTFLVVGDSGSADANQEAVAARMAATPADFILHTGDMIYETGAAADFDPRFFAPYADLIRQLVFWPCLGNHDWATANGQPWRDAFYTPANNPAGTENYYSFDFGNAHVVVLNSNEGTSPGSPQYVFADQDLARSTAQWKFVAFHHTIYPVGDSSWVEGTAGGVDASSKTGPGLKWTDVDTNADGAIDARDTSPWTPDAAHPIATIGAVASGQTVTVDVTAALQAGPRLYTRALRNGSANGVTYSSRQHPTVGFRPWLRLVLLPAG